MNNFDPTRQIAIIWDIDDVKAISKGLTDEQAMEVLRRVDSNHDSEYGVNWDTIASWIDTLYPGTGISFGGFDDEEE